MPDPLPTRDEIEQSQRICAAATKGPWSVSRQDACQLEITTLDGLVQLFCTNGNLPNEAEFAAHARTALPRTNSALLRLMDLLPYVQHEDGCESHDLERDYPGGEYRQKKCTCGLASRLAALGLGERGEGGGW